MTSRAGEGVPRRVSALGRSPSTRMRGRLGCGGSERSSARARSCTTSESVPVRCGCTRAHRPSHYGPAGDLPRLERAAGMRPHWGSPAVDGALRVRLARSEPRFRSIGRILYAVLREGFVPSRAFSCGLRRPHAASGCLSSAATLTHRAGSKCFLAAAHRANSLKRSTRPQAGVERWRPQRTRKPTFNLFATAPTAWRGFSAARRRSNCYS
jgi:hypothetical protein